MLRGGTASVELNGCRSRVWNITRGVRQGGVLSAHLFGIYVDEILQEMNKQNHGCYLDLTKMNSQAYADDFAIYCPTAGGLRVLLSKFSELSQQHELEINADKTKIMIFHNKRTPYRLLNFELNGKILEQVEKYKFLGSMLTFNMKECEDIKRLKSSFNRKVGMFNRKFHSIDLSLKVKLFNIMCMDMFGMNLWWDTSGCSSLLKQLAVSYHYALKKIIGLPKRTSNHYTCYLLDVMTFEHLLNFRMLKLYRWMTNCQSPCFTLHKEYFLNHSMLKRKLDNIFLEKYQVDDISRNDIDALKSRIFYVQNREEASWNLFE